MGSQSSLFEDPPRRLWSERLQRIAETGTYWTPWGPQNGLTLNRPAEEPAEDEDRRARPRRTRSTKKVLA